MKKLLSQNGMTAVELLVASTFALFLTLSVFSFTSFMSTARHEYQSNVELTNDARQIIEKLVWGQKIVGNADRHGIAEAVSGTIDSATQFSYTDINNNVHTIRLNGGNIEYRPSALSGWSTLLDPNGSAVYDASKYTTNIAFTAPAMPNSVEVKVTVGKNILGRWYYGSTATQVFYRNA